MANNDIPPPRVDFAREVTGANGEKKYVVTREWYYYLRQLKLTDEEITLLSITNEGTTIGAVSETAEVSKRTRDAYLLGFRPNNDAAIRELDKKLVEATRLAWQTRLSAEVAELRKKLRDIELVAWIPDRGTNSSGSDVELDCDTIEALGYWTPVTDGASNIIYTDGEVTVTFVCND